jgi:hypothetical protein
VVRLSTERCRRFVLRVIAGTLGLWAAMALFNAVYDPLWFFWPEPLIPKLYTKSAPYLFAGLPRTHTAQFIVAGQSHSQNFLRADIRTVFGIEGLNLAMVGSTAREESLPVHLALETGSVRRVLWEVNLWELRGAAQALNENFRFPVELYGERLPASLRYVSSLEAFDLGLREIAGEGAQSLDRYGYWGDDFPFGCAYMMEGLPGGMQPWFDAPLSAEDARLIADARASLEANMLATARRYPHVRFDLYLPPATVAAYEGNIRVERTLWETVLDATAPLANVHVFNFRAWEGVVDDYSLFKDADHFRPEINRRILEEIAADRMTLSQASIERDWPRLMRMIEARRGDCSAE